MGSRHATEHVDEGEPDRHQDPLQHPEHQHRRRGRERDPQLGAAVAGDAHELADLDQPQRGVDDDRGERGVREPRQHRLEREDEDQGGPEGGQPGPPGAPAHRVDDRRPAARAADGEPADGAGRDVGRPEGEQLAACVDPVGVAGAEGAGGQQVVGEPHHRHRQRRAEQRPGAEGRDVGDRRVGEREVEVAHHPDPVVGQVRGGDDEGGQQHPEQRDRSPGPPPGADQEQRQRPRGHRGRPALDRRPGAAAATRFLAAGRRRGCPRRWPGRPGTASSGRRSRPCSRPAPASTAGRRGTTARRPRRAGTPRRPRGPAATRPPPAWRRAP